MDQLQMNRREALRSLAAMTAALLAPGVGFGQAATQPSAQPASRDRYGELLPLRKLGKTGAMVTMLGLGGSHIGRMEEAEAQKTIETCIEGGVRFFDSAVVYQRGGSEERLGRLLTPKYRDVVYLMTKTQATDAATARKELDDSLRRLKTDYLDLWQLHENISIENVDQRIDNGVIEVFLEAQAAGKAKHIGFTGHTGPDIHLRMLQRVKAEKNDVLQTCQMPVNIVDPSYNSFILKVLPTLMERNYGVIAMKTLSSGGLLGVRRNQQGPGIVPHQVSLKDAMHFVWSLPISVLVSGPNNAEQFKEMIELARSFSGMDEARRQELIAGVAERAGRAVEHYKA